MALAPQAAEIAANVSVYHIEKAIKSIESGVLKYDDPAKMIKVYKEALALKTGGTSAENLTAATAQNPLIWAAGIVVLAVAVVNWKRITQ